MSNTTKTVIVTGGSQGIGGIVKAFLNRDYNVVAISRSVTKSRRRRDLTHEQFIQYWKDKHASLLMNLDALRSSVRNYTQQHSLNNVPGGFRLCPMTGSPRCGSMTCASVWAVASSLRERLT
jgi:NAD(P)-dependent dehydrogenase (short-subunit alcohol dehydrogenase family)